ncbi:hypothetical protein ACFWIX_14120 [Pseudarthrobacter sp. NPDC058362]|uniref:hypothetical protein n=1 Tax=Pseudarthrobacter sp. NPDC058362 TaxID=3346458 RepID=UPI00364A1C30
MDHQLQAAGDRAGRPAHTNGRRRAGLPAKRFFRRFVGFADVPDQELELLAAGLRKAVELGPASPVPALKAVVRREVARRKRAGQPEGTEEPE